MTRNDKKFWAKMVFIALAAGLFETASAQTMDDIMCMVNSQHPACQETVTVCRQYRDMYGQIVTICRKG